MENFVDLTSRDPDHFFLDNQSKTPQSIIEVRANVEFVFGTFFYVMPECASNLNLQIFTLAAFMRLKRPHVAWWLFFKFIFSDENSNSHEWNAPNRVT